VYELKGRWEAISQTDAEVITARVCSFSVDSKLCLMGCQRTHLDFIQEHASSSRKLRERSDRFTVAMLPDQHSLFGKSTRVYFAT
jgi:hypothetical protein